MQVQACLVWCEYTHEYAHVLVSTHECGVTVSAYLHVCGCECACTLVNVCAHAYLSTCVSADKCEHTHVCVTMDTCL